MNYLQELSDFLVIMGIAFIAFFVRIIHEIYKGQKPELKKHFLRLVIGTGLAYVTGKSIDKNRTVIGVQIYSIVIFIVSFSGVSILDFLTDNQLKEKLSKRALTEIDKAVDKVVDKIN